MEPAPTALLPAWRHLQTQFIDSGLPGLFVVSAEPRMTLFLDPGATRFGVRLAGPAADAVPLRLASVQVRDVVVDGERLLEIATSISGLFETFHLFLTDLVPRVVVQGVPIDEAVVSALDRWKSLLHEEALMTEERQQGLFGELWCLRRLLAAGLTEGLASWTGAYPEAHDFRLSDFDLEVKTTRSARRIHIINGLSQLASVGNTPLYLLSIRLESAGQGGESLPELVHAVAAQLGEAEKSAFDELLVRVGYVSMHADRYRARWRLAAPAVLVPVVDGTPRLTREAVDSLPSRFAPERISEAQYRVDIEGLGFPDQSPDFLAIIPGAPGAPD